MTKILIVDDSQFHRKKICKALANAGFDVCSAANGKEALDCIHSEKPDFMITDLHMPVMAGLDLLREIQTKGLKINCVVASADVQPIIMEESADLGALAYISKPFEPSEIIDCIHALVKKKLAG